VYILPSLTQLIVIYIKDTNHQRELINYATKDKKAAAIFSVDAFVSWRSVLVSVGASDVQQSTFLAIIP
jgi:hypothetical protein